MTLRLLSADQHRAMDGARGEDEPDVALLLRAGGDGEAFAELYRRHVDAVVRFAARRADDPDAVVDLVAAVWLEVLGSLERFDVGRGPVLPWILGIAANLCASERRRKTREREALRRLGGRRALEDDEYQRLERRIDAEAAAAEVAGALRRLPAAERIVAELVLVEGVAPRQAAATLGLSAPAVRMRLSRARRKLQAVVDARDASAVSALREEASP